MSTVETRPELEDHARRVDEALAAVEALDGEARQAATDLKAAIEQFHRLALVQIVRRLREDPRGKELLFELVDDPAVHAVLALHGIIRPTVVALAEAALDGVRPYLRSHGGLKSTSIRYQLLIGSGVVAAKNAARLDEGPIFVELWSIFCAVYAGNRMAIERLAQLASESQPYEAIMLLRSLARHGPKEELDKRLEQCAKWFDLPEWFQIRLRCELAFDKRNEIPAETVNELERLANSEDVPTNHRAEILHNLGTMAERQHDLARAQELWARAKQLDPQLD